MSQPPGLPWPGPTERERSRRAAEQYALTRAAAERRRMRRLGNREVRLRRLRHRTAQWLVATARRVDVT